MPLIQTYISTTDTTAYSSTTDRSRSNKKRKLVSRVSVISSLDYYSILGKYTFTPADYKKMELAAWDAATKEYHPTTSMKMARESFMRGLQLIDVLKEAIENEEIEVEHREKMSEMIDKIESIQCDIDLFDDMDCTFGEAICAVMGVVFIMDNFPKFFFIDCDEYIVDSLRNFEQCVHHLHCYSQIRNELDWISEVQTLQSCIIQGYQGMVMQLIDDIQTLDGEERVKIDAPVSVLDITPDKSYVDSVKEFVRDDTIFRLALSKVNPVVAREFGAPVYSSQLVRVKSDFNDLMKTMQDHFGVWMYRHKVLDNVRRIGAHPLTTTFPLIAKSINTFNTDGGSVISQILLNAISLHQKERIQFANKQDDVVLHPEAVRFYSLKDKGVESILGVISHAWAHISMLFTSCDIFPFMMAHWIQNVHTVSVAVVDLINDYIQKNKKTNVGAFIWEQINIGAGPKPINWKYEGILFSILYVLETRVHAYLNRIRFFEISAAQIMERLQTVGGDGTIKQAPIDEKELKRVFELPSADQQWSRPVQTHLTIQHIMSWGEENEHDISLIDDEMKGFDCMIPIPEDLLSMNVQKRGPAFAMKTSNSIKWQRDIISQFPTMHRWPVSLTKHESKIFYIRNKEHVDFNLSFIVMNFRDQIVNHIDTNETIGELLDLIGDNVDITDYTIHSAIWILTNIYGLNPAAPKRRHSMPLFDCMRNPKIEELLSGLVNEIADGCTIDGFLPDVSDVRNKIIALSLCGEAVYRRGTANAPMKLSDSMAGLTLTGVTPSYDIKDTPPSSISEI